MKPRALALFAKTVFLMTVVEMCVLVETLAELKARPDGPLVLICIALMGQSFVSIALGWVVVPELEIAADNCKTGDSSNGGAQP